MVIIVSVGLNNEIGRCGDLCWHIPEDLRRFKALTTGHPVIMGRKTWESLPRRPLPGRLNIIVSSGAPAVSAPDVAVAPSVEAALDIAESSGSTEPFVIGGASIYAKALPLADRLEITRILADDPEADTFFPDICPEEWKLEEQSETHTSKNGVKFRYETYTRKE